MIGVGIFRADVLPSPKDIHPSGRSEVFVPQPASGPENRFLRPLYSGPFQVFQPSDTRPDDGDKPAGWPDEGYDVIRNPAIVRAANGNLVVVADGRVSDGPGHDSGSCDLVSRVSSDDGETWSETVIVSTMESPEGNGKRETHAHHALVTAPNGDILLVFSVERWGTRRQGRCFVLRSRDHGVTWEEPEDIGYLIPFADGTEKTWATTKLIDDNWDHEARGGFPESRSDGSSLEPGDYVIASDGDRYEFTGFDWKVGIRWFSWGAGNGIVHSDGSVIFIVAINRHAAVMRSVDDGQTWTVGPRTSAPIFESDPVELSNGDIMTIGRSAHYMTRTTSSWPGIYPAEDADMLHWFKDREGNDWKAGGRRVIHRGPNLQRVVIFSPDGQTIKNVYDHTALVAPISNVSTINITEAPDPHIIAFGSPVPTEEDMRFTNHIGFLPRDRSSAPWTIRLSYDDGKTWPVQRVVPDVQNQSKLVNLGGGEFGVVSEYAPNQPGYGVQFVSFSIGWLLKYDPLDPGLPEGETGY